ncbi:mechanosensitive ion channel family protein [Escherichia coli]|nr:mechanosensitive ion channel family protein [Escherichia coli]
MKLELAQLSANNRQELARLRSELAEKESSNWMRICRPCVIN